MADCPSDNTSHTPATSWSCSGYSMSISNTHRIVNVIQSKTNSVDKVWHNHTQFQLVQLECYDTPFTSAEIQSLPCHFAPITHKPRATYFWHSSGRCCKLPTFQKTHQTIKIKPPATPPPRPLVLKTSLFTRLHKLHRGCGFAVKIGGLEVGST